MTRCEHDAPSWGCRICAHAACQHAGGSGWALNPDPLRAPETDSEPSCCELACYEDPGCACPGCDGQRSVDHYRRGDADLGCGLMVIIAAVAALAAAALLVWIAGRGR